MISSHNHISMYFQRYKKHNKELESMSEKPETHLTKTVRQAGMWIYLEVSGAAYKLTQCAAMWLNK